MVNENSKLFFNTNSGCKDKVKKLQSLPEKLNWEQSKCSCSSPGPVNNEENVYRQAPSPVFYDEITGKLTPAAFDEVFNRGCSVDRENYASLNEIYKRGYERTIKFNEANPDRPPRTFSAIAKLLCREIRSHKAENGEQSMAIYDTALPENPSHAEICAVNASNNKKTKRSIRSHLFDIAQVTTIDIDENSKY